MIILHLGKVYNKAQAHHIQRVNGNPKARIGRTKILVFSPSKGQIQVHSFEVSGIASRWPFISFCSERYELCTSEHNDSDMVSKTKSVNIILCKPLPVNIINLAFYRSRTSMSTNSHCKTHFYLAKMYNV